MLSLSNKKFELMENGSGHAAENTSLLFSQSDSPFKATFSGPNIEYGHAIVSQENSETIMLYHSVSSEGELSAGKAVVTLSVTKDDGCLMQLNWHWLTGDLSSGVSTWREVSM